MRWFRSKDKGYQDLSPEQVQEELEEGDDVQLIDVRTAAEHSQGYIPGARLMPMDELERRSEELDRGRPTVVYCARGHRSKRAARRLVELGFEDVKHMEGGIRRWPGWVEK